MIDIKYLKSLLNTIKQKQNIIIQKKDKNIVKLKKMNYLYKKRNKKINSYFQNLQNTSKININNYIKMITQIDIEQESNIHKILDKINKIDKSYDFNNILIKLIENKINDLNIINLHKNILQLQYESSKDDLINNIIKLNKII